MKQFIKYIVLMVCGCSLCACMDDKMDQDQEIDYSKLATLSLSIDFSDLEIVTPGTKSAGDAIGKMANVCVLFYNTDGTLAMNEGDPISHYATVSSVESVKINAKVPAGEYKVVAVANMGDLVNNRTYSNSIKTLAGLKSISLQWNNDEIAANNQMFGFFSEDSGTNAIDDAIAEKGMHNVAPTSYDAPNLVLSGSKTLYAKLYRTVAKVSVAFDGEGLNRNVVVTVKSIRLGSLPATCQLWTENNGVTDTISVNGGKGAQSEVLTEEDFGVLRVFNRGVGESLVPKEAHSQTGPSLFMFENRQGTTPTSGHKDKTKSKKPYGAFIEIEAYYANEETGSNGKIIYRYMLGEDIPGRYDNYNLTRNRHYKVTLMLQKSGKEEPYWRVEYTENPSINIPTEVNISYRNSAKLDIPFTVAETNGGVAEVVARIVQNPWYDDLIDGHRDATVNNGQKYPNNWGFLTWAGFPSDDASFSSNKDTYFSVQKQGGQYKLSVQTEALGFRNTLGEAASFTGYNNYSNPRTATIEVTIRYRSSATKTVQVKVVQVPRVVNPIAIYRRWDNDAPFNIRLLNAFGKEIESYGPWSAEVESGKGWIQIKKENAAGYGDWIDSGDEGGAIRFDYKPSSRLGNDGETRCGVIVVRFSNYKVEHRIYVRQGYAPMAIGTSDNLWTSFNYIGVDANNNPQFTTSPMEEGAWLRSGNSVGIVANNTDNTDGFESAPGSFKMSDGRSLGWNSIGSDGNMNTQFIAPGYERPTQKDVFNITALREYSGFGIGYDDNATKTVAFDEAGQYTNPAMGRRGFVICDSEGRNLFFPTGKRGYGRRRLDIGKGGLHYTHATSEVSSVSRPALIGLPKAMGAIYWANGKEQLSFNYSIANIESANAYDSNLKFDACFARLVKGSDVVSFEGSYLLKIGGSYISPDQVTVSISSWGSNSITEPAIVFLTMPSYYKVTFKYNVKEVDKANSGVVIRVQRYGQLNYEAKLSINELEAQRGGDINLTKL